MPATAASTGQQSSFEIGNATGGTSTTYTAVSEVLSVRGFAVNRDSEEATHLNSPEDFKEYIPGLIGTEPVTIEFNYVAAASDTLFTAIKAGIGDFRMVYPNGVKLDFSGVITRWKPGEASANIMRGELVIQPSGVPVLAAAV